MSDDQYKKIFSKNLRYYMSLNDKSQIDLISDLGFNKSAVSTWCNGTRLPRMDKVDALAKYFNIKRSDLIEEHTNKEPSNVEPVSIGKTVRIPVYGRIPAGVPIEAVEDIEDYINVDAELAAHDKLLALKVVGDSMKPKYLDGDYVLIKEQPDCESGQDCAVRVNGCDVTLKKVIKQTDGIMLQPINPEYEPRKYDYTDEFNPVYIIGIVVELRRKI